MIITYDSQYAIAICSDSDEHFELQGYSLKTFERTFCKNYDGEYIKMNVIEQNYAGDVFGVAYQDNGKFFVSFMNNQGEELDNLAISEKLFLDDLSKPITGFWEPLVTCCFIQNDDVFISAYHREQKKQYHFTYSYKEKKMLCDPQIHEIPKCTAINFPIKSFYSQLTGNCHTFYRQG